MYKTSKTLLTVLVISLFSLATLQGIRTLNSNVLGTTSSKQVPCYVLNDIKNRYCTQTTGAAADAPAGGSQGLPCFIFSAWDRTCRGLPPLSTVTPGSTTPPTTVTSIPDLTFNLTPPTGSPITPNSSTTVTLKTTFPSKTEFNYLSATNKISNLRKNSIYRFWIYIPTGGGSPAGTYTSDSEGNITLKKEYLNEPGKDSFTVGKYRLDLYEDKKNPIDPSGNCYEGLRTACLSGTYNLTSL